MTREMTVQESMKDIVEREARALCSIPYTVDYDRAIELIIEHVHHRGKRVYYVWRYLVEVGIHTVARVAELCRLYLLLLR